MDYEQTSEPWYPIPPDQDEEDADALDDAIEAQTGLHPADPEDPDA